MPYTIILLIILILILIAGKMFKSSNAIVKFVSKDSMYKNEVNMTLNSKEISSIAEKLSSCHGYKLEYINDSKSCVIFSDKMDWITWGFLYKIVAEGDNVNVYLKPRLFTEINKFGLFETRLNRMTSLIKLLSGTR